MEELCDAVGLSQIYEDQVESLGIATRGEVFMMEQLERWLAAIIPERAAATAAKDGGLDADAARARRLALGCICSREAREVAEAISLQRFRELRLTRCLIAAKVNPQSKRRDRIAEQAALHLSAT